MSYGKLGVVKSIGKEPSFVILNEKGDVTTVVPSFTAWMLKRIGTTVSFLISDGAFEVVDMSSGDVKFTEKGYRS